MGNWQRRASWARVFLYGSMCKGDLDEMICSQRVQYMFVAHMDAIITDFVAKMDSFYSK